MRTSRIPAAALVAASAAALLLGAPAAAQPSSPVVPGAASGRVLTATFGATPPSSATYHGVCSPAVRLTFQGVVTTDAAQPLKKVEHPYQVVWSDARTAGPETRTDSADRRRTTLTFARSFDRTFDGWVLLQANPWGTTHPHNTPQVAVKVNCEPPVYNQLQHAPAGASKVPPPSTGPGR